MRFRHAAARALLGWYLMVPPLSQKGPDSVGLPPDTAAPYSKWEYSPIRDHFDTEEDCKNELHGRQELTARGVSRDRWRSQFGDSMGTWMAGMIEEQEKLARCVPDNDPNIKSN
jgi:hypothetical protein